jgi:hypothetical protein
LPGGRLRGLLPAGGDHARLPAAVPTNAEAGRSRGLVSEGGGGGGGLGFGGGWRGVFSLGPPPPPGPGARQALPCVACLNGSVER